MDEKLTDPREIVRCCCPRIDAADCYRFRYKLDIREMLGDDIGSGDDDECPCSCHAIRDEQLSDDE